MPLHGLDAEDRELLELVALLHDIGEHVSRDGHARHSAYLIENGDLRGFSPVEIQMLACLGATTCGDGPGSRSRPGSRWTARTATAC